MRLCRLCSPPPHYAEIYASLGRYAQSIDGSHSVLHVDSTVDWSETKIQDLVLFRNQSENSMTQLARATEVADCMYSRCLRTFSCEIVRTESQL